MHKWKIEDRRWKMEDVELIIIGFTSLLSSTFYLLSSKMGCGWAVYSLRIAGRISALFIPSPGFCTHFVRSLWLTNAYYPLLVPSLYPQNITDFPSVNRLLSPLPTGLTIRATFLRKLNNKTIRNTP